LSGNNLFTLFFDWLRNCPKITFPIVGSEDFYRKERKDFAEGAKFANSVLCVLFASFAVKKEPFKDIKIGKVIFGQLLIAVNEYNFDSIGLVRLLPLVEMTVSTLPI
jgi:hypothetical protein